MKTLPTFEQVSELLSYDPETGIFRWKVTRGGWIQAGRETGSDEHGYVSIGLMGRVHRAHRLAWLLMTGEWPRADVDHIDGDTANNRWSNLRDIDHKTNSRNTRRASRHSKTGVLGVYPSRSPVNPFAASIRVDGKAKHLGHFPTIEAASAAYQDAKSKLHPGAIVPAERKAA